MKEYNPMLQTYEEQPTQEAVKAAEMVNRYMYWIANQINKEKLINAFGSTMGEHYWQKLRMMRERAGYISYIDLSFWFELDTPARHKLMHYIMRSGYRAK